MMMVWTKMIRPGMCSVLLLWGVISLVGPSSYAAEGPRRITREELRHEVMRFAGRSTERVGEAYDIIERQSQKPELRLAALENKFAYVTSSLDIAIAPDPEVNVLDMVVMVTLSRIVAEEYWVPQVFGSQAKNVVEVLRRDEADIWSIAGKVLTPQQQQELREVIQEWRKRNPDQTYVEPVRFGDFAGMLGDSELAKAQQGGGFLGVKGVTREVGEARLLAERAMFYAQRVPYVARWMAKLALYDVTTQPQIQQLLANTTRFTEATREFAQVAKGLPKYVSEERKATIDQLMSQEKPVRGLLGDVQQTLTAGTALAAQLDATVGTVESLFARLHARREEPTDIKDVQKVLQQSTVLIKSIDEILTSPGWDQRFPQLVQVVDRIESEGEELLDRTEIEGEELIDHTFSRGVLLILIFFLAMLGYRYASVRLIGSGQERGA